MARSIHISLMVLALLLASNVRAAETDQYLARGAVLADSSDSLNDYFNDRIERLLVEINTGQLPAPQSCTSLTSSVMWQFRLLFKHQVEFWALNGNLAYFPPKEVGSSEYRAQSIYDKGKVMDLQKLIPLSRTIRVGDIHLGIDKLGHFVSLGHKYFMQYKDLLKVGESPDKAETAIVEAGFDQEVGMIGERVSGVVSFADMEANYQGFLFTRSLCAEENPRIVTTPHGLKLSRPLDIREYVNPYWDESFNNNVYSDSKWELVRDNLQLYCTDPWAETHYKTGHEPLSANMQRVLKAERELEIRPRKNYSLASACTDTNAATE